MWNRLFRYYNQNRRKIFTILIILVSLFLLLQFLNEKVKQEKQEEYENRIKANQMGENLISQVGNPMANQEEEKRKVNAVSQETTTGISNEEAAIKQFIAYCNDGKVQEAYSMLSEDCREEVFQTQEQFQKNYYESKFATKKVSSLLNWMYGARGVTYQVKLYENLLESGSNQGIAIEDYITVDHKGDQYVLSINSYMGRKKIGKSSSNFGIEITVNYKDSYYEYEQFNISVRNGTNQRICLDPKTIDGSTYLLGGDSKEVKYSSYIHELTENFLVLNPGETKSFNIKFNKSYTGKDSTNSIRFENTILNYDEYLQTEDKRNYNKKVLVFVNF